MVYNQILKGKSYRIFRVASVNLQKTKKIILINYILKES